MPSEPRAELLPGTLDLLVLRTLALAPMHGYGIAQHIHRLSDEVLKVEEGSLYPALQRLQRQGLVTSTWAMTPTKRRARYYRLTPSGRKRLGAELSSFEVLVQAIGRVLRPVEP